MKKGLKIWLIVWWSLLVAWWAWAWLTKTWVIPNWFGIELLCPWNGNGIRWDDNIIYNNPYNNYEDVEECWKILNIKWYTKEKYEKWANKKSKDEYKGFGHVYKLNVNWYNIVSLFYTLSDMPDYEERLDDKFSKYKNQIIECEYMRYENWNNYVERRVNLAEESSPVRKPIIYLYPTAETEVNVKLWTPGNLSHTYPEYNFEKWRNVIAQPNWDLEDVDTWRKLYALYREWKSNSENNFDEWFLVKWKDTISFLEEKLAILWLNEREAEEFIIYWLHQMENNAYNLIRFETKIEQDENMPLNITPTPDTVIRVMMDWKAIDEPIDIPEQQLVTPERSWFTVVEWWGSPRN